MTTGISDLMISSGLNVPIPEIPMPDLAVPIAAPAQLRTIAAQHPANPKNGANAGEYSDSNSVDLALVAGVRYLHFHGNFCEF
ncbi:hypothetical protein OGATHE_000310 [Ogataea polymorpha]|uniref:Uncharacterized protein n=1 Tax=Ogataea polymorpha TaxID=460523 RepID=A0A9P8TG65_9ASCO|nr:hypothetical protein OGATHE_000310 [Ogataea polymorpha]